MGNVIGKEKNSTKKSKRQTIQKYRTQSNGPKALNVLWLPGYLYLKGEIKMRLHVKIVLTIIVTLLLLIYLAGFLTVFSQAPTNWVITGRIVAPGPETTASWIPVTNAILTLTDFQGDIHIVSTGKDGYYFFKNLAVNAKSD